MKETMDDRAVVRVASQEIAGSHHLERFPADGVVNERVPDFKLFGKHIIMHESPGADVDGVVNASTGEGDDGAVRDREIDHFK